MNTVALSGRIRSEVRVTYTQTCRARASWILEVPRCRGQTTARDYLPCIAWGEDAEIVRDFGGLDARIELRGEVQSYKNKAGDWIINVVADEVSFPDRREKLISEKGAK